MTVEKSNVDTFIAAHLVGDCFIPGTEAQPIDPAIVRSWIGRLENAERSFAAGAARRLRALALCGASVKKYDRQLRRHEKGPNVGEIRVHLAALKRILAGHEGHARAIQGFANDQRRMAAAQAGA